jgi:hypothetical protein
MTEREPLYLEQLIPPCLALDYAIRSKTLLTTVPPICAPQKPIMEVPEKEGAIRAALIAAGEKPMICQHAGRQRGKELLENKKRLQKLADIFGRKLVFVKGEEKNKDSL